VLTSMRVSIRTQIRRLSALPALVATVAVSAGGQRPVRVCAGGDVAMGTNLDTRWATGRVVDGQRVRAIPDPLALTPPLVPLFAGADIALVNVEGAIGSGPAPQKCSRRSSVCYAIRQPPGTETALRAIAPGATVVGSVANNHARDAGAAGFAETLRRLESAGVLATGADTLATPVPVAEGDTIAILGFSVWNSPSALDLVAVRRHVARAVERYRRVIVTAHIGAEGAIARRTPDRAERFAGEARGNSVAFARAAAEVGAVMVLNHGPHVLRGIEWAGNTLVAHSLGNLLTYGPFNLRSYNGRAAVLCATIEADGSVSQGVLHPTRQVPPGVVSADPDSLGIADIRELSATDFPRTGAVIGAGGTIGRRP
jgi:hypothetical protein